MILGYIYDFTGERIYLNMKAPSAIYNKLTKYIFQKEREVNYRWVVKKKA